MHGLAFFFFFFGFIHFVCIILHNFTQVSVYCRHLISQPRGYLLQDLRELGAFTSLRPYFTPLPLPHYPPYGVGHLRFKYYLIL